MQQTREYKDTFFRHLLGVCKSSNEYFLDVFNALFNKHLTLENTNILDINLGTTFYTKLRNDVAKVIDNKFIILLEHQSTINENMPLRFLQYISATYPKILDANDKYKEHLVKIPTPLFFVFYNGQEDYPIESTQKLSGAFIDGGGMLELTVKIINIGAGKGAPILQKSQVLNGYSTLCDYITNFKKDGYEDYVQRGVEKAIENDVLANYLKENKKEVINMFFSEYDYNADIAVKQNESWQKGMKIGMQRGMKNGLRRGIHQGILQQKEKDNLIIADLKAQIERLKQGK